MAASRCGTVISQLQECPARPRTPAHEDSTEHAGHHAQSKAQSGRGSAFTLERKQTYFLGMSYKLVDLAGSLATTQDAVHKESISVAVRNSAGKAVSTSLSWGNRSCQQSAALAQTSRTATSNKNCSGLMTQACPSEVPQFKPVPEFGPASDVGTKMEAISRESARGPAGRRRLQLQ